MDLGLKDKVAIIGGASKGLGRACAQVLAEEGARVVICSRTAADLEQAADEIRESTGARCCRTQRTWTSWKASTG